MSINTIQVVAIGIRLFAIVLVLHALQYFGWWIWGDQEGQWVVAIWLVPWLLAAVLLWCFPKTVAAKLVPPVPESQTVGPATAEQVQIIGTALVGLWVLASAVPALLGLLLASSLMEPQGYEFTGMDLWPWNQLATELLRVVIGAWLVLGARGVSSLIRKLRQV